MPSIAVGSENPVKVEAATLAFKSVWPALTFDVRCISVPSGVSAQPMSDDETLAGAIQRAIRARDAADADFGVGLESGICRAGGYWFNFGWVAVVASDKEMGLGSTARIRMPDQVLRLVLDGQELGQACDAVFNTSGNKKSGGYFGHATNNLITRIDSFQTAAIAALSTFANSDLWGKNGVHGGYR